MPNLFGSAACVARELLALAVIGYAPRSLRRALPLNLTSEASLGG